MLFQAKSGGGSEDALVYTQVCRDPFFSVSVVILFEGNPG